MSSSSTFSTDDPSLEMDDLAIHEQLLSLLDDDEAIPLATSPKLVLKHFLSGGIETLEDPSFDLKPVLDAAKALSLENPSNSSIWDHFSSKIKVASSSYKLNLEKIQAGKDAHQRFAELKESAKESTTRFKALKDEKGRVDASKELIQSEITALRAQLAELEKKAAEIDGQQVELVSEMKGQVGAIRATQVEIRTKDAERATSEAWLSSLKADWNAWRGYLD